METFQFVKLFFHPLLLADIEMDFRGEGVCEEDVLANRRETYLNAILFQIGHLRAIIFCWQE